MANFKSLEVTSLLVDDGTGKVLNEPVLIGAPQRQNLFIIDSSSSYSEISNGAANSYFILENYNFVDSDDLSLTCFITYTGSYFSPTGVVTYTSTDGINWSYNTASANIGPHSPRQLVYGSQPGIFCSIGEGNIPILISTNGTEWTNSGVSGLPVDFTGSCIAWSEELEIFCAVGERPSSLCTILTSSDGLNWGTTYSFGPAVSLGRQGPPTDIIWLKERKMFFAAYLRSHEGQSSPYVYDISCLTSPDGINWEKTIIAQSTSARLFDSNNQGREKLTPVKDSIIVSEGGAALMPDEINITKLSFPNNIITRENLLTFVNINGSLEDVSIAYIEELDTIFISSSGYGITSSYRTNIGYVSSVAVTPTSDILLSYDDELFSLLPLGRLYVPEQSSSSQLAFFSKRLGRLIHFTNTKICTTKSIYDFSP